MPISLCSSSGLQASEYPAIERLAFAGHCSRNEDELNPEFLWSLFHSLFTMRTEHVPEHHNGSARHLPIDQSGCVALSDRMTGRPDLGPLDWAKSGNDDQTRLGVFGDCVLCPQ
jgi:hypothetical protein